MKIRGKLWLFAGMLELGATPRIGNRFRQFPWPDTVGWASMTSSRIARETAKVANSISQADFVPRRQTRAFAASLQAFAYNGDGIAQEVKKETVKQEELSEDGSALSSASSGSAFDIEDLPFGTPASRKRKKGVDSPSTAITTISTATSSRTSPRKPGIKPSDGTIGKPKKARRQPAKRIVNSAGEESIQAPANWEEIYDAVREMRKEKLAPVDTMGCETLAEEHSTPRVRSFPSYPSANLGCAHLYMAGQTFPNPHSPHALLANKRHHQRPRHAPLTNFTPLPRPDSRKHPSR